MHPFDLDETIDTEPDDTTGAGLPDDVVKVFTVNEREADRRPEFGEGTNYIFSGTPNDVPVRIVNRSPQRHRAVIFSYGVAATIFIGSYTKVMNGQGFAIKTGTNTGPPITIESQSEVWAMSDKTVTSSLSVWEEKYA